MDLRDFLKDFEGDRDPVKTPEVVKQVLAAAAPVPVVVPVVPVAALVAAPVVGPVMRPDPIGCGDPRAALDRAVSMYGARSAALDYHNGLCSVGVLHGVRYFARGVGSTWESAIDAAEQERYKGEAGY